MERWEDRRAFEAHCAAPHPRHARKVLVRGRARPLTLRTPVEASSSAPS
ncbi:hypothetical protein [Streptomyces noursei]